MCYVALSVIYLNLTVDPNRLIKTETSASIIYGACKLVAWNGIHFDSKGMGEGKLVDCTPL